MRLIALTLVTFAIGGPAGGQNWQEYSYPDYALTVTFPADPQIETTSDEVADGRSVPARAYSVRPDEMCGTPQAIVTNR